MTSLDSAHLEQFVRSMVYSHQMAYKWRWKYNVSSVRSDYGHNQAFEGRAESYSDVLELLTGYPWRDRLVAKRCGNGSTDDVELVTNELLVEYDATLHWPERLQKDQDKINGDTETR